MKEYRKSNQVVYEVLEATKEFGQEGIKVTPLAQKANLQHTRLKKLLGNLLGNHLIVEFKTKDKQTYVITEKGIQYLEEYKKFNDIAESFGLEL